MLSAHRVFLFGVVTAMTVVRAAAAFVFVALMAADAVAYAAVFFLAAAALDFDGFFARRWGVATRFGAFLDPLADKILVVTAVAALVWYGDYILVPPGFFSDLYFAWTAALFAAAAVIVLRELCMIVCPLWSLLRDVFSSGGAELKGLFVFSNEGSCTRPPVTELGRAKMGAQCVSIGLLTGAHSAVESGEPWVTLIGDVLWLSGSSLFLVAGYFTFVTGADYLRKAVPACEPVVLPLLRRCWLPWPLVPPQKL